MWVQKEHLLRHNLLRNSLAPLIPRCETITSLPFGDGQNTSGPCNDSSPMHFTGYQRDSEASLDFANARHYGYSLGRFMQPDPSNAGADPGNPQSLNMYAYVNNNPLNAIDPSGTACVAVFDRLCSLDPACEDANPFGCFNSLCYYFGDCFPYFPGFGSWGIGGFG